MHAVRLRPREPGDPPRIGRYTLVGRLGQGGMGVVYAGRADGGPLVAVKAVLPNLAQAAGVRERFVAEAALVQRVDAACAPRVLDADLHGRRPWLAMEYVPGPTLYDHVRSGARLRGERLLSLGAGTAEALAAIHRAGVVHLDLKTRNIILSPYGPRILDFGMALAADAADHDPGGTFGFRGPERERGTIGPPADVFSWGVVMVVAATGHNPFARPGGDGRQPSQAVVEARIRAGEADLTGVAGTLRPLVRRALDPDPGRRPRAEELRAELARALGEEPATESAQSREHTSRLFDRHWGRAEHDYPVRPRTRPRPRHRTRRHRPTQPRPTRPTRPERPEPPRPVPQPLPVPTEDTAPPRPMPMPAWSVPRPVDRPSQPAAGTEQLPGPDWRAVLLSTARWTLVLLGRTVLVAFRALAAVLTMAANGSLASARAWLRLWWDINQSIWRS